MNRKLRIFALVAILCGLGRSASSLAQDQRERPTESPLENLAPKPESLLPNFEPEAGDQSRLDPGYNPPRWLDQNDQYLDESDPFPPGYDPYRERPGISVGWFAAVDLNVVRPQISSQVNNSVLGPGDPYNGTFTNSTQLPFGTGGSASDEGSLDWTVMPKISLGYRFENGMGELITSYRGFYSQAGGTIQNFDALGAGRFKTTTQAHVLDVVYGVTDRVDGLPWFFPVIRRWGLGLRAATWIFDTTANGQQTLSEQAGSVFEGGGPVLQYDWTWLTRNESLTFNGGFDVAGLGGFHYLRFSETALLPGSVNVARGRTDGTGTGIAILTVWGGLAWVPDWGEQNLRFTAGYRWERWWDMTDTGGQNELTLQGPFVRGEWRW
ncbi:MAG: hypothetical protein JSS02_16370 [Planctomycetes bacterium]|nr:hypothetical protein [Planctomycetota bacterium]